MSSTSSRAVEGADGIVSPDSYLIEHVKFHNNAGKVVDIKSFSHRKLSNRIIHISFGGPGPGTAPPGGPRRAGQALQGPARGPEAFRAGPS